jgi:prevent-host-death family protein
MEFYMAITVLNTADAKEQFTDLINRVVHNKERVILTRRGKEIAAIIPLGDLALLQEIQDRHDLRDAINVLKEVRSVGTMTLDQLREDIGV